LIQRHFPESIVRTSEGRPDSNSIALLNVSGATRRKSVVAQTTSSGDEGQTCEDGETGYGVACDCWSLGVIIYILLCGYPPFIGRTATHTLRLIRRGQFKFPDREWNSISSEAKDVIQGLLDPDEETRMTAADVLEHGWIEWALKEKESRKEKKKKVSVIEPVFTSLSNSVPSPPGLPAAATVERVMKREGTEKALVKAASNLRQLRARFRTGVIGVIAMKRLGMILGGKSEQGSQAGGLRRPSSPPLLPSTHSPSLSPALGKKGDKLKKRSSAVLDDAEEPPSVNISEMLNH